MDPPWLTKAPFSLGLTGCVVRLCGFHTERPVVTSTVCDGRAPGPETPLRFTWPFLPLPGCANLFTVSLFSLVFKSEHFAVPLSPFIKTELISLKLTHTKGL